MNPQLLQSLFQGEAHALDLLKTSAAQSPESAVSAAWTFLSRSSEEGRHYWGGFRESILKTIIDAVGSKEAEQQLLNQWGSFLEESRLDFAYELGGIGILSIESVKELFFHCATSFQCKGSIIGSLLQSSGSMNLDESLFFGLLNELSARATPPTRDSVELFCIQMYEMICVHFGLPN